MPTRPAPITRRLLAALETHAHEDTGPIGLADWAGLSALFDRELQLLTRLATAAEQEGAADAPDLRERANALQARYRRRSTRLSEVTRELREEHAALEQARRRGRAVAHAYSAS